MEKYVQVRCPGKKKKTHDGSFPFCGRLIGAIRDGDGGFNVYMRCPSCSVLWLVSVDFYGNITMTKETGRVSFVDKLKEVD